MRSCQRPGCPGSYEDFGGGELYCGTCGLAPVVSADGMVGSPATGVAQGARRGGSGSSSRSSSGSSSGSSSRASTRSSSRSSSSRRSVPGRLSGRATARPVPVRSSGSAGASSGRNRLGAGLVTVPEASIHYTAARVAAVRARLRQRAARDPLLDDLTAAAGQVERLRDFGLDAVRREVLSAEVLGNALDWVLSGRRGAPPPQGAAAGMLLGSSLDERGLRLGLERSYRVLARLAQRGVERIELVEKANRLRPRTWV